MPLYHIAGMQDKVRIELCDHVGTLVAVSKRWLSLTTTKRISFEFSGSVRKVTIHSLSRPRSQPWQV